MPINQSNAIPVKECRFHWRPVGTGPEAHALRHHLERMRQLGYTF